METTLAGEALPRADAAGRVAEKLAAIRSASPKTAPEARSSWNRKTIWIRRVHLYSGLFMFPWVLLYGITGMLFNHPEAFSDAERRVSFGPAELAGTGLAAIPEAGALAAEVVAALNAKVGGDPAYRLADGGRAEYSGPLLLSAEDGERRHTIRLDPNTGAGTVATQSTAPTSRPTPEASKDPFAALDPIETDGLIARDAQEATPRLLDRLGLGGSGVQVSARRPPTLNFEVEGDGRRYRAAYSLQDGRLSARPADGPGAAISTRSFLLRLHTAHGYPLGVNARWVWAVLVDAMFASMVFWGISGLIMWWQLKKTRILGVGFLVASVLSAAYLVVGMHESIARSAARVGPRAGEGPGPEGGMPGPGGDRGRDRGDRAGRTRAEGGLRASGEEPPRGEDRGPRGGRPRSPEAGAGPVDE